MIRGEVVWHKFKEPDKKRPVLILTRDGAISELNAITVVPITTSIRDLASQVLLTEEDGVKEACVLNVDWIQTVPKNKLGANITILSEDRMDEVFEAIKFAFGFDK
ncbi:MAG: type II toxin-antitoxin system PemK/MazF family toxin [Pyrinomonadaceae bacterium]|nr:type II toxin-antitoxin system PemK/MazF family toxin [Blastocatellia bacterium]MDQ3220038.1 type II toxin-antitoxin system PemK/MazF family toxin [Acidobacteriota bacterium]MDQ3490595.1 type II toxin-antitoxin system PemK/MazF family toxin [Acidobacteriota bacterium]